MKSKRNNSTGKYRSVKTLPGERLERFCPHLAFFEAQYYDRVTHKVMLHNVINKPGRPAGHHPCLNRPRKQTVWPDNTSTAVSAGECSITAGTSKNAICSAAAPPGIVVGWELPSVRPKRRKESPMPSFGKSPPCRTMTPRCSRLVEEEAATLDQRRTERLREIARVEEKLNHEISNIVKALREIGSSDALLTELKQLEDRKSLLVCDREEAERLPRQDIEIPSVQTLRNMAKQAFDGLGQQSEKFGQLMRQLIPRITVYPYQLIDHGPIVLRARFTLNLASLMPGLAQFESLIPNLSRSVEVDLFDPPQRVRFREQVVALCSDGKTQRRPPPFSGLRCLPCSGPPPWTDS